MIKIDKKYINLRPVKNNNLIRLGVKKDGGYVVEKKIIEKCKTLISFGLGPDWSFELDYKKINNNAEIFMYDYTVSTLPYVKQILKYLKRFCTFRANYSSVKSRISYLCSYLSFIKAKHVTFFKEKITYPVTDSGETDIKKVFSRIHKDEKVILKCDIEGSEFDIINQIVSYSHRIDMMVFEFHWLDRNEEKLSSTINKFQKNFDIIHIHGNNHCEQLSSGLPVALEVTFLNKKFRDAKIEYVNNFPLKDLDYPNNPNKKDISFSFKD